MAKKLYDVVAKVGSYTKNGQEKNKYQNVGVILDSGNGPYLIMNRYFNPAGVPCDPSSEGIILSLFKPQAENRFESSGPTDDDEVVF